MRYVAAYSTVPWGNTALTAEEQEEEKQRQRIRCMQAFDKLPAPVRAALRDCPFDVHFLRSTFGLDHKALVSRIESVKTMHDAMEFMRDFA